MNYRHAFHAGNFADVLKHLILTFAIMHLRKKDKPFRVIDTHAGIGVYDLRGNEASRTGEWIEGIRRLLVPADGSAQGKAAARLLGDPVVSAYLDIVRSCNNDVCDDQLREYPGSPALAAAMLRPDDRLIANELHPEDTQALQARFARNRQVKILNIDGWLVPKSTLPPKERRGVVLIDPPFELEGEFKRMCSALQDGLRRFESGIFLLWYPAKDTAGVTAFKREAAEVARKSLLATELFVRAPETGVGLTGCGVLIHNPPFGLQAWLSEVLPPLCDCLRQADGASWHLEELN